MRRHWEEGFPARRPSAARVWLAACVLACLLTTSSAIWALDADSGVSPGYDSLPLPAMLALRSFDLAPSGWQRSDLRDGLLAPLVAARRNEREASLYHLSYESPSVQVKGTTLDVGAQFAAGEGAISDRSAEDQELLERTLGQRALNLTAGWKLARGLALSSTHDLHRRDSPLDAKRGLTSGDSSHSLALDVGTRGSIKASLTQHRDAWDRWLGRQDEERSERKVEFQTGFGRGDDNRLRLALTSVEATKGGESTQERAREAHLNLAPTSRLRLHADYLSKDTKSGESRTTETVGGALQLGPQTELSGSLKRTQAEGKTAQESALALAARLGGDASGGRLALEQKLTQAEGGPAAVFRKCAFAGGLGRGTGRTNVNFELQETRSEGSQAELTRNSTLHVDRAFGPRVKLSADRRTVLSGTTDAPQAAVETRLELAADLGSRTQVSAHVMDGEKGAGAHTSQHRLALSHEWGKMRLRLEQSASDSTGSSASSFGCSVEAPAGDLPEWAKTVSTAHQFSDAGEYLLRKDLVGAKADMPFAGYRLWAARRSGVGEGQSFGFAHRRVVAGRWQVNLSYEQRPLGTGGEEQGLPLPLTRQSVELGAPVWRGVNARGGYATKTGLDSSGDQVQGAVFGLWGRLGSDAQVEGQVSHDAGRWQGAEVSRSTVSLLYSRRVSEEEQVEIKLGYAWGEGAGDAGARDCRLALSYGKPI